MISVTSILGACKKQNKVTRTSTMKNRDSKANLALREKKSIENNFAESLLTLTLPIISLSTPVVNLSNEKKSTPLQAEATKIQSTL